MTTGAMDRRRKALEEDFFAKKNQQLLDKLKETFDRDVTRESLRAATGIMDPAVLDRLIALRVSGETMAAFALYPLVEVAWADGKLDRAEHAAILAAAANAGVAKGSPAYQMLENRMAEGPIEAARKVWREYAQDLAGRLAPAERRLVREDLLKRARAVAEASGGVLGFGKVSAKEQSVLDVITAAFPD
jgi:hypothetical protein